MRPDIIKKYAAIWEKEAHKCSKCGKCRSFCTVFLHTNDEKMGTRGRISLASALSSNEISFTPEFLKSISMCMRCLRCSRECPSQVDFDKLIRGVRGVVGESVLKYRLSRAAVRMVFQSRRALDLLTTAVYLAQKFLPRKSPGLTGKLPFFYRGAGHSPMIAGRSA